MILLLVVLALCCAGTARAEEAPSAVLTTVRENGVGAKLDLGTLDPLVLPALTANREVTGGKMIYCGSPEYCPGPGILYRDTFSPGTDVRLYFYHVNASPNPLRFSIVLEPVDGPAVVDLKNSIVLGPSIDYFNVGRMSAFIQLGRPTPPEPLRLEVNKPILLDPDMDRRIVPAKATEFLVHTLHDFRVVNGTVRLSTIAVAEKVDSLASLSTLQVLPRDKNHDRGTYEGFGINWNVAPYSTEEGVKHIRLADGKNDPWLPGGDMTLASAEPYRGAYGVIYRVQFKTTAPDGRKLALVLNPRGGGMAGAVAMEVPGHGKTAGYVPALGRGTVKNKEDGVILAKWNPRETPEVTIVWTPPGAASLPVEWLLIPY